MRDLVLHNILATPRHRTVTNDAARENEIEGQIRAQLFAALTAAHVQMSATGASTAVAVAWERVPGSKTLRVLVGGSPVTPFAEATHPTDNDVSLSYPPGTRATKINIDTTLAAWSQLCWNRCVGSQDPLWVPGSTNGGPRAPRRGGFEDYVAHLRDGFVWLVVAQPVLHDDLRREIEDIGLQLPTLRLKENSETGRIALARCEARFRELVRAEPSGLWNVRVLVGATDSTSARRAAALLCSAADLHEHPYVLQPELASTSLSDAWEPTPAGNRLTSPFVATSELFATLARPPRRELAGVRLYEPAVFDLTPEQDGELHIGDVLDDTDHTGAPLRARFDTINRHTFVAGATGSGKSQTVRHILEGLHTNAIPWLVIEPAKAEYAGMAGRIDGGVAVLRPGDPDAEPLGMNPLQPEPGFPLQTHIDLVRALFLAAFDANDPFPQVLAKALSRCYTGLGWNTVLGESESTEYTPKYPNLGDLHTTALKVVESIGYSREITDNVRGFVDVRISSLRLGTPGVFFEGRYPIDVADLLSRNVVLEIENVGNDQDKAFFIGVVLIRLYEHLWTRNKHGRADESDVPRRRGLAHVTVVEEAHRLLKKAEPGTPAAQGVEMFAGLLAEVRAYGEGIIVAEQIPNKITPDVVKNTALKILHRLPAKDDRDVVGGAMNLDTQQSRHVVSLLPGRAAVFADGMDRPIRVQVPTREHEESPARTTRVVAVLGNPVHLLTLREIQAARRVSNEPRFALWLELHLVAHLTGYTAPQPNPHWRDSITESAPRKLLEEAVHHRVEQSVHDRYVGISAAYQPEKLIEHLNESAMTILQSGESPCLERDDEYIWQAGQYRWSDVYLHLKRADGKHHGPHPLTSHWADRGIDLSSGSSIAEQLQTLRADRDWWAPAANTILGNGPLTTIERLVDEVSNDTTRSSRFLAASGHLTGIDWAPAVLDFDMAEDNTDEQEFTR
ncbi:ATP-binding protein [Nocardia noduli]|uniref:ATP-binding protein n=1 Tax=Nocardia noduli TaxID=2815722 RepID=UPI001C24C10D|nr:ATP-binding protein [Nocardia noduli]